MENFSSLLFAQSGCLLHVGHESGHAADPNTYTQIRSQQQQHHNTTQAIGGKPIVGGAAGRSYWLSQWPSSHSGRLFASLSLFLVLPVCRSLLRLAQTPAHPTTARLCSPQTCFLIRVVARTCTFLANSSSLPFAPGFRLVFVFLSSLSLSRFSGPNHNLSELSNSQPGQQILDSKSDLQCIPRIRVCVCLSFQCIISQLVRPFVCPLINWSLVLHTQTAIKQWH